MRAFSSVRRIFAGVKLTPGDMSSIVVHIPMYIGGSILLANSLNYRRQESQLTILTGSKDWDRWCSGAGSNSVLGEEGRNLVKKLIVQVEERRRTEDLLVRMGRPGIVVILPPTTTESNGKVDAKDI